MTSGGPERGRFLPREPAPIGSIAASAGLDERARLISSADKERFPA